VEGLMAQVMVVQGNFIFQNIANTLLAVCFLSIHSPGVVSRLTHALEPQINALAANLRLTFELNISCINIL